MRQWAMHTHRFNPPSREPRCPRFVSILPEVQWVRLSLEPKCQNDVCVVIGHWPSLSQGVAGTGRPKATASMCRLQAVASLARVSVSVPTPKFTTPKFRWAGDGGATVSAASVRLRHRQIWPPRQGELHSWSCAVSCPGSCKSTLNPKPQILNRSFLASKQQTRSAQ